MRYILIALALFSLTAVTAKERTRKNASIKVELNFFDTAYSQPIELSLDYDSDFPKPYHLRIVKDSANEKHDSTDMQFNDPVTLQEFETALNVAILDRYTVHKTISQFSVYQLYFWMVTRVYPPDTLSPLAGVVKLGTYVKYFKNNDEDDLDYFRRVYITDSITDRIKNYFYERQRYQDQIAKHPNLTKEKTALADSIIEAQYFVNYFGNSDNPYKPGKRQTRKSDSMFTYYSKNPYVKYANIIKDHTYRIYELAGSLSSLQQRNKTKRTNIEMLNAAESIANSYNYLKATGVLNSLDSVDRSTLQKFQNLKSDKSDTKKKILLIKNLADAMVDASEITMLAEMQQRLLSDSLTAYMSDLQRKKERLTAYDKADSLLKQTDTLLRNTQENIRDARITSVKKVDLQFERGFLENIKVVLEIRGRELIFENSYAIGFTSKSNYRQLANIKLFARLDNSLMHIWLTDVLRLYDNEIDLYTRDYSPADTLVCTNPAINSRIELHRASFTNLFETKFYTDLEALNAKQPNGLVQFEVARKMNLFTKRFQAKNDINYSYGSYLYVYGSLNKIEKNNRYLPLRNNDVVVNNTLVSPSYATNLDFLQYRNVTLGLEANLFLYDVPSWKNTFTIDFGVQYGHTPVADSARTIDASGVLTARLVDTLKYDAHLTTFYPKFMLQVFSERRVGFSIAYQPQYTILLSNNLYKQIASYAKSNSSILPIEPRAHWSHMFELFIKLELNQATSSKLFFRSRFYWQQGDANTYFPQVQLGYSYNLSFSKLAK
ncbi:MAG: hypothetical protein V4649_03760 [Bacteroidota bacterium]